MHRIRSNKEPRQPQDFPGEVPSGMHTRIVLISTRGNVAYWAARNHPSDEPPPVLRASSRGQHWINPLPFFSFFNAASTATRMDLRQWQ